MGVADTKIEETNNIWGETRCHIRESPTLPSPRPAQRAQLSRVPHEVIGWMRRTGGPVVAIEQGQRNLSYGGKAVAGKA